MILIVFTIILILSVAWMFWCKRYAKFHLKVRASVLQMCYDPVFAKENHVTPEVLKNALNIVDTKIIKWGNRYQSKLLLGIILLSAFMVLGSLLIYGISAIEIAVLNARIENGYYEYLQEFGSSFSIRLWNHILDDIAWGNMSIWPKFMKLNIDNIPRI